MVKKSHESKQKLISIRNYYLHTKSYNKQRSLDLGTLLLTIQCLNRRDFAVVYHELLILVYDKCSGLLVHSQPIATPPFLERLRQESLSKFLVG